MTTVEHLRALLQAASDGRWYVEHGELSSDDHPSRVHVRNERTPPPYPANTIIGWQVARISSYGDHTVPDAALICAAVNALPALLEVAEAAHTMFRDNDSCACRFCVDHLLPMHKALEKLAAVKL